MLQLKPSPPSNNSSVCSSICAKHSSAKISSGKVFGLIMSKRLNSFDYSVDVAFREIYLTSPIVLAFRHDTPTTIFQKKRPYFGMLPRPKNNITQNTDATPQTNAILSMQRTAIQLLPSYTLTPPVGSVNKKNVEGSSLT